MILFEMTHAFFFFFFFFFLTGVAEIMNAKGSDKD